MRRFVLVILGLTILAPTLGFTPAWDDGVDSLAATAPATAPSAQPATQPATQPTTEPTTTSAATAPASQPTTKPAKPKDRYLAVIGGTVHPVSGADLTGVTILCKNGRIQSISRSPKLPDDAQVLDATGYHVYPGLIASNTRNVVGSEPPEDTTNVFATSMRLANAGGITTAIVGNTAAKVSYGSVEGLTLRKDLFVGLRYRSPAEKRSLRESLDKVRDYLRDKDDFERRKAEGDKEAKPPDESPVTGGNARFLQLIKKEKAAVFSADSRSELDAICELVETYGIRAVVRGAVEGWTIPDRMGRAGIQAIVTPRRQTERDQQLNHPQGGSIENAAILYSRGVEIAITPGAVDASLGGLAGRDLQHIPMEAALAVSGGLPEKAAIESITLTAARIHGIADRVGSIEVGKDADFIICSGRLLEFFTMVEWTVVNGRIVYDKQADTLFADIRPRTPTTQPARYKFWPRPFKPRPAPQPGEGGRYGRSPLE
ncbi:MAG: amidohydrolase family protein [Phycisphaerae bacterium]|nr:amidohydrolase family protein [Phycisphaerae bacterium]